MTVWIVGFAWFGLLALGRPHGCHSLLSFKDESRNIAVSSAFPIAHMEAAQLRVWFLEATDDFNRSRVAKWHVFLS